ncbi:MAG: peptide deformylase, partial [Spirillospora sp.]
CLSIPGMYYDCRRHLNVAARGWNMHGEPLEIEGSEMLARCLQHETDHLDGVLFLERLPGELRREAMTALRQQLLGLAPVAPREIAARSEEAL